MSVKTRLAVAEVFVRNTGHLDEAITTMVNSYEATYIYV